MSDDADPQLQATITVGADVAGAHGVALVNDRNLGFATGGKDGVVIVCLKFFPFNGFMDYYLHFRFKIDRKPVLWF